jgi:hypothetical protein
MFIEGMTFVILTATPLHTWVIISDPIQNSEYVVHVNFTTLYPDLPPNDPRNDRSCVLVAGDHSSITHTTIVYYGGVLTASAAHLTHRYNKGSLRLNDAVTPTILDKIRRGAAVSDHITPFAVELLMEQHLI